MKSHMEVNAQSEQISPIAITREQLTQLKNNHQFIDLLQIARIENSLSFFMKVSRDVQGDSCVDKRQRLRSFLFVVSILHEALSNLLVLENKYGTKKEFADKSFIEGFEELLRQESVTEFFKTFSKNVRDQTAFHFDRCALRIALRERSKEVNIFANTDSLSRHDIYFELADELDFDYQISLLQVDPAKPTSFHEICTTTWNIVFEYQKCSISFIDSRLGILLEA